MFNYCKRDTSRSQTPALMFSSASISLTAALSSLQLPLPFYLLTHLSRGEVVAPSMEELCPFRSCILWHALCCFLVFPSFLLFFLACNLLSKRNCFLAPVFRETDMSAEKKSKGIHRFLLRVLHVLLLNIIILYQSQINRYCKSHNKYKQVQTICNCCVRIVV